VRLVKCEDPRPGQIVAYECGDALVVHRVRHRERDHVICRGDNRVTSDPAVRLSDVIGRAVEVVGPGRAGGTRLRDDRTALLLAEANTLARRAGGALCHVGAELALVVRQARGRLPADLPRPFEGSEPSARLQTMELAGLGPGPSSESGAASRDVRAAHYSALPREHRVALVRERLQALAPDETLQVRALALGRERRLARASALLRAGLLRVGVSAGEPGDTTWPLADGSRHVPVHVFSHAGLLMELGAAGGRVERVILDAEGAARVWNATVADAIRRQRPAAARPGGVRSSS
jgi:hypothetical protein